eukprot:TRINITY_DN50876_c0_g1_i1.p1 TRINITY_DN50876_c0_g1~~TRINITY_DN50876_c0_g1_i1.p1  ORF type:complete len:399 (-),score=85.69 TRINITY_DN50876_c0_g1_i1:63-1259(-)
MRHSAVTSAQPFGGGTATRALAAACIFAWPGFSLEARSTEATNTLSNSFGTDAGFLGHVRRAPIITGCLDVCGVADQSCATECQVCVERRKCSNVETRCRPCLKVARAARRRAIIGGDAVTDSGGIPLVRDGLRLHLERAQIEGVAERRQLNTARGAVLVGQRLTEWAAEERRQDTLRVSDARMALRQSREEITKWRLRSAKRLKALRRRLLEARAARQRADREKQLAEEQLKEVKADGESSDAAARALAVAKEKAESREDEVLRREKDYNWVDHGLQEQLELAKDSMKGSILTLRRALAAEDVAWKMLRKAKERYQRLAVLERRSEQRVNMLKSKVANLAEAEQKSHNALAKDFLRLDTGAKANLHWSKAAGHVNWQPLVILSCHLLAAAAAFLPMS